MLKPIDIVFSLTCAVLILIGCSSPPSKKASEAMESWKSGQYENLYQIASSRLRNELPKEFFLSQIARQDFNVLLDYRIVNTETSRDTAKVTITVSVPDFSEIPADISASIINRDISDKDMRDVLAEGKIIKKNFSMDLLREHDGWRINSFKPLDEAAKLYKKKMTAQSYADNVKIISINASESDPSLGDHLVKIEGKIENTGKELLSKVEITVRFKNEHDQIVHEAKAYPILISGCTSADIAMRMQNSGEFWTYITMQEKWTGAVEGEITDIELGDEHIGCGG